MEGPVQVSKWGASLAVRLPKKLVEKMGLNAGDELEVVEAARRTIAVAKTDKRARFLEDMEAFHWPAPDGYTFDRNEANER
jgi:antitoxin MazE